MEFGEFFQSFVSVSKNISKFEGKVWKCMKH